ncbi:extracellular solute-binding protein [Actinoplanes sp. NPDC089786]|uniref:ABC transporter substrate-binding protein n=1 Tax=Actinoplanes sp. NPDC089786 TaxID=3155185 RepID=UPI00342E3CB0
MRRFIAGVLSMVIAGGVAACSPGAGAADGDVKLSVWGWRTEDVTVYNKIFEKFEGTHPGIDVEYRAYKNTEYNTILQTGLSGDSGPDLAQLRAYGELQPAIASGGLLALDAAVPRLASFPAATLDGARGRADGRIYGVPFAIQTMHVVYNKKLFADNGVAPPQTWQQMLDGAATLQRKKIIPFAVNVRDDWMIPIEHEIFGATRYGGAAFEKRVLAGEAKFTDPDYVASIETYAGTSKYWQPQFSGVGYEDAKALFVSGKAAMFPGGVWELAGFRKSAPDIELGIFSVPPSPGAVLDKAVTPGFVDGSFGVATRTRSKDEAVELARWMATPEFGQAFSDQLIQISAVPGTAPTDPLLKQAFDAYTANPSPYLMYADFSYGTPPGAEVLRTNVSAVLLGTGNATDAAKELQRSVDTWFKPRG